jgi:dephospho-CoA kinase
MDVYGLTGGIGSGKSTVADMLEAYGVPVVSADELSRIVVARGSEGLADVVQRFGPGVLDEQGDLDRRKMAALVFQDPSKRRELEAILHPRIRERFEQVLDALEKAGHEVTIYEVPLLFEKNLQGEMKAVILVTAEDSIRTERVRARDDVTETEVRARMATQLSEAAKRRKADYVIENNGSVDDLRREVEFLLARFLRLGGEPEPEPPSDPAVVEPSRLDTVIPTDPSPPAVPPRRPQSLPGTNGPGADGPGATIPGATGPGATLPPADAPSQFPSKGGTLPAIPIPMDAGHDAPSHPPTPAKGGTLPPTADTQPRVPAPPDRDASAPPNKHTQRVPPVPATGARPRPRPGELAPTVPDDEPESDDE